MGTVRCITLGTPVYNRAAGAWQLTVRITNTSGKTLTKLAFALDTLAAGWTVTNGDAAIAAAPTRTSTILPTVQLCKRSGALR
ncbi:hypothetical protein [Bryobacter aggregatus]|uniref:hypothetical protein n=1 Tax=Bryobacter aggregatus TaxID=360054 RepID=UPI0004E18086|nr:hypothetical protein [Bryobacter aggregatus]